MHDSEKGGEKPIEAVEKLRTRKAKLERISPDTKKLRKPEKPLQAVEDLYRAVMDNTFFGFTLIDRDYKIVLINSLLCRYFRKPASELIGKKCFREFEKNDAVCPQCPGTRVMATGQPAEVETEKVRDDGSHFSACIQAFPTLDSDGAVTGFIEIVHDITERKKAEDELQIAASTWNTTFNAISDSICCLDSDSKIVRCNKAFEKLTRKPFSEIVGRVCCELVHGSPKPLQNCPLVRTQKTHNRECSEINLGNKQLLITVDPILNESGNIQGVVHIISDITERKKAEQALRESEEKYRGLVENSPNLVAIYQEGTLKYVNQIMCEKLGWTFQEMTSPSFNPVEKIIPQRFQSLVKDNIAKRLRGENIPRYEISIKTRDGSEIPVIVNAQMILYHGEPADEVIHTDICLLYTSPSPRD